MTEIYIDADACPVKDEAIRVAERHGIQVHIVSNGGIRPNPHPLVEVVVTPLGPDAADDWIAERAGPGDVCVTSDIPLARRCVAAGAKVVKHNGEPLTPANIGAAVAMRDLMTDLRAANPLSQGGGGPMFGKANRSRFLNVLENAVQAARRVR